MKVGERRAETQRRVTAGSELLNSVSLLFFASHDRHPMMIIGFLCEENHPKCNLFIWVGYHGSNDDTLQA